MKRRFIPSVLSSWLTQRRQQEPAQPSAPDAVVLHCFGVDVDDWQQLQQQADLLTEALGLPVQLAQHEGDIVLVDDAMQRSTSLAVLEALIEERPRLVLRRAVPAIAPSTAPSTTQPAAGPDIDDLLAQMRRLRGAPSWRRVAAWLASGAKAIGDDMPTQPADSGYDSGFNSRWPDAALAPEQADPATAEFLHALHAAKLDPSTAPFGAVYGDGGVLQIDAAAGRARCDADAWLNLRLLGRLPRLQADAQPSGEFAEHELDQVLWLLGLAAADLPLLKAPEDWWHAPITAVQLPAVGRYTLKPAHLAMARVLARGGVTPSQLRRECRVSERELRGFLQACLFLCLVWWRPAQLPDWADEPLAPGGGRDAGEGASGTGPAPWRPTQSSPRLLD
jgi:hypothetical protein